MYVRGRRRRCFAAPMRRRFAGDVMRRSTPLTSSPGSTSVCPYCPAPPQTLAPIPLPIPLVIFARCVDPILDFVLFLFSSCCWIEFSIRVIDVSLDEICCQNWIFFYVGFRVHGFSLVVLLKLISRLSWIVLLSEFNCFYGINRFLVPNQCSTKQNQTKPCDTLR